MFVWIGVLCCSIVSVTSAEELRLRVCDATGAPVPAARVDLSCNSGHLRRAAHSNDEGYAQFSDLPAAICTVQVSAEKLASVVRQLDIRVDLAPVEIQLLPARSRTEIVVAAGPNGIETSPIAVGGTLAQEQLSQMPVFNRATGFTDILTSTTPGVAADSNGFAHPLGEHADTSILVDGQPITDQQAKVFSNQLDPNSIDSLTATTGAPPAEFGGKTSLVVSVTTKSGLGAKSSGFLTSDYGSFGTWNESAGWAAGNDRWGNFLTLGGGGSDRFLDSPEFLPLHDRGNSSSLFNRTDWHPRHNHLLHLNVSVGRSWFQTPNSYDSALLGQDQLSQIRNGNLAAGWTWVIQPDWLVSVTPFLRRDRSQYFPSRDNLADRPATLGQDRTLTNTGFRAETQFTNKAYSVKIGTISSHTLLHEKFSVGLTDPLFNAPCVDGSGQAVAATEIRSDELCETLGFRRNPAYLGSVLPFDLSRGGGPYRFDKRGTIDETAFYLQGEMRWRGIIVSPGLRYDIYNGLSRGRQLQPRIGLAWQVPGPGTLLRASYARLYETPYNENLIFANESGDTGTSTNPFGNYRSEPVRPGTRNQFNVGLQQRFGKYLRVDADYYWKFTRNAFDFDTLFNTPITFSVAWKKSKIDGLALRLNLLNTHGFTAYSVMGHVRSRFFTPQVGGLIFNSLPSSGVFRIDHGEEFEQTTNIRYQFSRWGRKYRPWIAGVWRFSSGLALPDTVPVYTDAFALTPDQQSQMGLGCGTLSATPTHGISQCSQSDFRALRIRIPDPGTANDDLNPVRVKQRTLFDLSAGEERLFKIEGVAVGLQFSVTNVTNRVALYNFLSTFSGTHFVPPRAYQVSLRLSF